jgi:hypothetical protein
MLLKRITIHLGEIQLIKFIEKWNLDLLIRIRLAKKSVKTADFEHI